LSSLDLAFAALVGLCVLFGALRGVWRELMSVAVVIAAVVCAALFGGGAARHFGFLADASFRRIFGFVSVFLAAYLLAGIAAFLVRVIMGSAPPGRSARIAGSAVGLIRGIAIVIVVVLLGGLTSAPKHAWWRDSLAVQQARPVASWVRAQLPPDIARHFARS
jgi:membrane protein required for colicin V production